jgi:hypothetical protein
MCEASDGTGLDCVPRYVFSDIAVSRSRTKLPPSNALSDARQKRARSKHAEAVKRAFIARRDELSERFRGYPVRRVAALLIALSELNAHEGRDPRIADSLRCETIASCLKLDLDTLGRALDELQQMRLVALYPASGPASWPASRPASGPASEPASGPPSGPPLGPPLGLRLTNLAGLYALANETPGPVR